MLVRCQAMAKPVSLLVLLLVLSVQGLSDYRLTKRLAWPRAWVVLGAGKTRRRRRLARWFSTFPDSQALGRHIILLNGGAWPWCTTSLRPQASCSCTPVPYYPTGCSVSLQDFSTVIWILAVSSRRVASKCEQMRSRIPYCRSPCPSNEPRCMQATKQSLQFFPLPSSRWNPTDYQEETVAFPPAGYQLQYRRYLKDPPFSSPLPFRHKNYGVVSVTEACSSELFSRL